MNTFRVEDGVIKVSYDRYTKFNGEFGHLFYKHPFSDYKLRVEYRFVGDQVPGGPGWAFRNSGAMIHCQPPETMRKDQEFPVSIEVQFLGGSGRGQAADGQRVLARHPHRDGRQADHPALHRIEIQDLQRRPVGDDRGGGSRQRHDQALRQRRARDPVREAAARRQRPGRPETGGRAERRAGCSPAAISRSRRRAIPSSSARSRSCRWTSELAGKGTRNGRVEHSGSPVNPVFSAAGGRCPARRAVPRVPAAARASSSGSGDGRARNRRRAWP